jgi:hypothetical protein
VLGNFLEFSVRTPDIIDSLSFYKLLGFHELESGDVWSHPFAVVSDGAISIGLHDREFDGPALTFVHQELAKQARSMTDHGFDFRYLQIDEDAFNELGFVDRDNHLITMIEARTFSRPDEDLDNSLCGHWFEVALPVRDALHAGRFWAPLAPELLRMREEPTTHMRFNAAGLSLGLSESIALTGPSLCFRCEDREAVWIALAKHGFVHQEFPGFEGAFMSIQAPEGTNIFLFDEDYLGELYEVEESVEE